MRNHCLKLGSAHQNGYPFICRLMPFICSDNPVIIPLIGHKLPLVWNKGFTLIELIVTITIVGILAAIAVPSMGRFVESNRLTTLANDLIADINLARSEAIKTSAQTAICAVSGSDCGTSTNWGSAGWRVFLDADNSGTWTTNDTVIRSHQAAPLNNSVTAPANFLVFSRLGGTTAGAAQAVTVCNSRIKENRTLTINPLGRVTITQGSC